MKLSACLRIYILMKTWKTILNIPTTQKKDLEWEQECGFILDITPGVYNGALDKTYYSELTTENIYSVLLEETPEYSFQYLLKCEGENDASETRQVRLVTEFYKVFTIGKHLYIDYD